MPLLRITVREGVLDASKRAALADALTDVILIAEVGRTSDSGRRVAHVLFQDVDPGSHWFTDGRPAANLSGLGLMLLEVVYPEAASDAAGKAWLYREIAAAAARVVIGPDAAPDALATWVHVHEVAEGAWGVRGRTLGVQDVIGADGPPERIDYARRWLAATARQRQAHEFPAAIAGAEPAR